LTKRCSSYTAGNDHLKTITQDSIASRRGQHKEMTTSGQDRGIQIFKNPLLMGTLIFNVELSADYIIGETNLDVLLTVHLSIILVINQLNAQFLVL
jgi:hypothetical protein